MGANDSVVYISYDGVLAPLAQSQVLGYLEKLADSYRIHLISFEKATDRKRTSVDSMRSRLRTARINWTPLKYHKKPTAPATAYDIAVGTTAAIKIAQSERAGVLHVRSYVPALMALPVKALMGVRILFDIRGFWADERVDGGLWKKGGMQYRVTKALERRFFKAADHVVTLTHASVREIEQFPYLAGNVPRISVIPTCADLDHFRPGRPPPAEPFTFGYVGSVGTWYLFEETLAVFKSIRRRRPDAKLLIVNRGEHDAIRSAVSAARIPASVTEIVAAEHRAVPVLISRMHVAAAIIKPCFSKTASAPTKLAEYLGCGVPCVGNIGVGDMEAILEGHRVGVAIPGFSESEIESAADRLMHLVADAGIRERCVSTARRLFSLDDGVKEYQSIYDRLLNSSKPHERST